MLKRRPRSGTHVVEVRSVFAVELVEGQLVIVLRKHTGGKKVTSLQTVCVRVCVFNLTFIAR